MRDSTLLFLIKRSSGAKGGGIAQVCLAMKKRGFGSGRWNGTGGKCKPGESIEDAAVREAQEEIGVTVSGLKASDKVAELEFRFPQRPEWDQIVHTYFCERWEGQPMESEEMRPRWFAVKDIPYAEMWPSDIFWIPKVLAGDTVKARFVFGDGDVILEQKAEAADLIK